MKWRLTIAIVLASLVGSKLWAQSDIPLFDDSPKATETFTVDSFDYFAKILGSNRLAPHLDCELRAVVRTEDRKFSDGTRRIELIEVTYRTQAGYGGDFKIKIPITAKYGRKVSHNHWSGIGEDVKIELGDYYDHYIRFIHDGQGHIVFLILGNNLMTLPCIVRE